MGGHRLYLQTVRAKVWLDRSKMFDTLTDFYFFSYTLSRNKTADAEAGIKSEFLVTRYIRSSKILN